MYVLTCSNKKNILFGRMVRFRTIDELLGDDAGGSGAGDNGAGGSGAGGAAPPPPPPVAPNLAEVLAVQTQLLQALVQNAIQGGPARQHHSRG